MSVSPRHRSASIAGARLFAALLIVLLSALAPDAQGQPSIGIAKTALADGTSTVDITSVDISGSNRALAVAVCLNDNDAQRPASVVVDPGGASQTSLTWLDNPVAGNVGGDDGHCSIWGVATPPLGTFTVRVTLTAATQSGEALIAGAWPLTGVDQTTPFDTAAGNEATSGNASVTVSSDIDDLVLGAAFVEGYDGTRWMEGSETEDWDVESSNDVSVGQHKDGASTNTTLNWTNDSWSGKWAAIGVSVNPALCPVGKVCWDGGGSTSNWSEAANWTGDAVPGTADDVVFDGFSTKNATFDAIDTIGGLTIEAGYTGTITMAADLLIDNAGPCAFTQNGGTIDLGSTTWTHECDWTYTAGTFTAGTSTVVFSYTGITIDSGTSVFNNVDISMATNTDFTVTGTMDIDGNLTVSQVRNILTGHDHGGGERHDHRSKCWWDRHHF